MKMGKNGMIDEFREKVGKTEIQQPEQQRTKKRGIKKSNPNIIKKLCTLYLLYILYCININFCFLFSGEGVLFCVHRVSRAMMSYSHFMCAKLILCRIYTKHNRITNFRKKNTFSKFKYIIPLQIHF